MGRTWTLAVKAAAVDVKGRRVVLRRSESAYLFQRALECGSWPLERKVMGLAEEGRSGVCLVKKVVVT
ncbi:unnamed protein product [Hydatigera taeniaeformis]|uniref:DUF982 domain-containing protein n=1 Tax=Hydatigena taeniaeformis TaxID=6205 RepID=A0A0R3X9W2_HYDTA|nr:unnamed protein product [Hydatigera taeniaeformis]